MKKARLIMILVPLVLFATALNCYSRDLNLEVAALEQKASRLQQQIEQAKAAGQAAMNQQIQGIRNSLNVLIRQRVAIDAQIARLEGQIREIKAKSQAMLQKQIGQYNAELQRTRSQIASAMHKAKQSVSAKVKRTIQAVKKTKPAPKPPAAAAKPKVKPPAPAAAKAKPKANPPAAK